MARKVKLMRKALRLLLRSEDARNFRPTPPHMVYWEQPKPPNANKLYRKAVLLAALALDNDDLGGKDG